MRLNGYVFAGFMFVYPVCQTLIQNPVYMPNLFLSDSLPDHICTLPRLRLSMNWMKAQGKESSHQRLDVSIELAIVADIRTQASLQVLMSK
jgi:hypothetical protein